MIKLGQEPEGVLLRKADVLEWLPGLSERAWRKVRPTLKEVHLPGGGKPYYRKGDVKAILGALLN